MGAFDYIFAMHDLQSGTIREGQEKIIGYAKAGKDSAAAVLLFGDYRKVQSDYLAALNEMIKFQSDLAEKDGDGAAEMAAMANKLILGLIFQKN